MNFFSRKKIHTRNGFTLVEIIIVMAILVFVSGIVWVSFRGYNRGQVLEGSAQVIVSILNDARARTVNGRDAEEYGVHIESGSVTLFVGDTYSVNTPSNEVALLDPQTTIADISLSGGDDVVFEKLTGATSNSGTLRIELTNDATQQLTVTVQSTGLVSYN